MQFYYRVAKVESISKSLLRKFGIGKIGMKKIEKSSLGIFIIPDKEKIGVLYGHEVKIYVSFVKGKKKRISSNFTRNRKFCVEEEKQKKKRKSRTSHKRNKINRGIPTEY